ncbi:hypothetical protein PIB30_104375 [Stylosanthes scabra]|uniref:Uncharacterized protein n=1 Tax=Stylosanthes scabra TaxID=79078 RepID=A0ABU6SZG3_9FABA|nr:hypothetical protein [Stylosanthes scabra]
MAARDTGKGSGRGRGRAVVPPTETTASPSTSATPGSTHVTSTPSPYLVVLNPDYHGPPPPPPPAVPPTVPAWTPPLAPPPPVDSTSPAPPSQQDLRSTHEPSENAPPESSHGSQPDPSIQFAPKNSPCTQEISSVIKLMYDQPWLKWKAIPPSTRHRMYKKWAEKFVWSNSHDATIKKIFDHRASRRFSGMMEDVRKRREQLTQWCRPELKKALYHFWETDEKYKHIEAMNKANRASERCAKYTGGSATPIDAYASVVVFSLNFSS